MSLDLSIVIFTRNDAEHLGRCLASLAARPPRATFETIVETLFDVGKKLIQRLWDGIKEKWDQLVEWFLERLDDFAGLWPFSEPKNPKSPLRGLSKAGEAIVGNVFKGMKGAMPQLDAGVAGLGSPVFATNGGSRVYSSANTYNVYDERAMKTLLERERRVRRRQLERMM